MDERIALTDGNLELASGGRTRDVAAPGDLVRLVQVFPADALFHGEESYYLGFLGDRVWVLPYFTPGFGTLLETLAPALAARGALFRAEVAGCPLPWRRRLLGLLPLFPTPALGSHPLRTTPALVSLRAVSA